MRSFLLVLVTIFVAAFAFGVYWILQGSEGAGPDPAKRAMANVAGPTTLPSTNPSGLGPGARPYWERRNPATGEITSRMRAASYQFLKDDRAKVIKPEVEFFLRDGQVVRITGETGTVLIEEVHDKMGLKVPEGAPRSGDMQKVTILMLPSATATRPTLTAVTNNISFDNETFRVQTAAYEQDGETVPAQLVPVTVRGDDYEFDGRGLWMRYDEVHRGLEFLQITYGQRLLVKHPKKMMKGAAVEQQPGAMGRLGDGEIASRVSPQLPSSPAAHLPAPLPGIVLAAATPAGVGAAVQPVPPAKPGRAAAQKTPVEEPVYRATFDQNVEIYQGGQRLATAQQLQVDFLGREGDELSSLGLGKSPETMPAASAAPAAVKAAPADAPTTRPATAPATVPVATKAAATQPVDQPIEVRWRGPLTVVPLPGDRPAPLAPGESIVRLFSGPRRPVEIVRTTDQGKNTVRCATLTHWTIDNGALLEGSAAVPVEMVDSRGGNLITQSMLFSQKDGTALLTGKSRAKIPLQMLEEGKTASKAAASEIMDVSWADRCTLHLNGSVLEEMELKRADLQGNVIANHPRVQLQSQTLQLAFAPGEQPVRPGPATRQSRPSPVLRQMDASGGVKCVTRGAGGVTDVRKIDCETLTLLTARTKAGELYAQKMVAIGQVHAVDADRDLKSGFMAVSLAAPAPKLPGATTRPTSKADDALAGQLESLIAHENVRVTTANGEVAEGDELVIKKRDDGETEATLHGRPATATRGKNVLSGPILDMLQDRQQLTVTGEGRLNGMSEKKGNRPARPVVVTWTKSMRADAKADLIECFGDVAATTLNDDNGSETIARGDRVRILTTQPAATQPAAAASDEAMKVTQSDEATKRRNDGGKAKAATTRPTTRPGEFDNLGERQVRSIVLEDNAKVDSVVYGPGGVLLRQFHTDSSSIHYDRENRKLTIPQAGRMAFLDNRPPAKTQAAVEAAKDPLSMRGNTAFSWNKSLVYDEMSRLVTLSGDVRVGRNTGAGAEEAPAILDADTMIAEIEPAPVDASKPAKAGPATQPDMDDELASKVQFKHVRAEGSVTIESKQFSATAATIDYDPAKHEMTVRGSRNRRAEQFKRVGPGPEDKMPVASFDELIWNTAEGQVVDSKAMLLTGSKDAAKGKDSTKSPTGKK